MNDHADQRPASSAVTMAVAASLVLDGFARVSMEEMRALRAPQGLACRESFPIAGTISALTCSWPLAAATVSGASRPLLCGRAPRSTS
jgi:hypothetical protein